MSATVIHIGLIPMTKRPPAGRRIVVVMQDGRELDCTTTMIYASAFVGIVIYHKRKPINEQNAQGWRLKPCIRSKPLNPAAPPHP